MFRVYWRKFAVKFTALVVVLAGLIVFWSVSNEARVKDSNANSEPSSLNIDNPVSPPNKNCSTCGVVGSQTVYAPIFDLPEAANSEIVLNCRSPYKMEVTPTFYTVDGTSVVGEKLLLQPAEIRYVTIKDLIPPTHHNQQEWGGISLSYTGKVLEVWAQLRLLKVRGGGSTEVLFTILNEPRSNVREAVWFTPQGGYSTLALGNSSANPVAAALDFGNGATQNVVIAPHATKLIRHHSSIKAQSETVRITEEGISGNLIPSGFVSSATGDYTSSIRFYAPSGVQSNLYATNLRVKNTVPHLLLKNTSAGVVTARLQFHSTTNSSAKQIELPAITIRANQIIEADLAPLLSAAARNADFKSVSVRVLNDGSPGSLIGSLNSVNRVTGDAYDIPLRDTGSLRNSTGSYPWRIDKDFNTIVSITNTGNEKTRFVSSIYFDGKKYVLEPRELEAGETALFDLRKIRDEQLPDDSGKMFLPKDKADICSGKTPRFTKASPDRPGKPVPETATIGQFRWSLLGNSESRLIGRSEMISKSQKVSSSYSCPSSCPLSFDRGIFSYLNPDFSQIYGTDPEALQIEGDEIGFYEGYINPMEYYVDEYNNSYGPYGLHDATLAQVTLSTSNSNIAVPSSNLTIKGIAEGSTSTQANWLAVQYSLNPYGDICTRTTTNTFVNGNVFVGYISQHAYQFISESFTGGTYGFGITDWEATCTANCSTGNFSSSKLHPGNSPNYLQCRTLRISGVCVPLTYYCESINQRGICRN